MKSWIESFQESRQPFHFAIIGKCLFCGGDATQEQCQLTSPTTKTESIKICGNSACFQKAMGHRFSRTDIAR